MSLQLTVLGCSSAIPAHGRGLSAQVLQHTNAAYLIDCGEGTQFKLTSNKIKLSRLDQIFISHLHGDHIFGLPGLLASLSMLGRNRPLGIFGPTGLSGWLDECMDISGTHLGYEVHIHPIEPKVSKMIFSDDKVKVYSIPLNHRVPASGFKFIEKARRNIDRKTIDQFKLDFGEIRKLLAGNSIKTNEGHLLDYKEHTYIKNKAASFAYISDTVFQPSIINLIKSVDLLFHEATYLEELSELAEKRGHSTAMQAAKIAREAEVGKLVIGHFSSRYKNLEELLLEARAVFKDTYLGIDGSSFEC